MSTVIDILMVGAGGSIGAVLRYLLTLLPVSPESGFPVKTFFINLIGSFVIGIVAALAAKEILNPHVTVFLKVGICGGFTTFSSFALETEGLIERGSTGVALIYVALSAVIGILLVFVAGKMVG